MRAQSLGFDVTGRRAIVYSQDFRKPTGLQPAERQTDARALGNRTRERDLTKLSATDSPTIAPRPSSASRRHTANGRARRRVRDRLIYASVRPLEPQKSPREAVRVCLFSAPSTTTNGAPKTTSSNRRPMRVFQPGLMPSGCAQVRVSFHLSKFPRFSTGTHTL